MSSPIRQRLASIKWTSPREFALDGVEFALEDLGDAYEGDALSVMKPRAYLDAYGEALADLEVRNAVELGIRLGGSTILLALLLAPEKLVAIDTSRPVERLERFRAEDERGKVIAASYRTSQDDEAALADILAREMDGALDLVIDDASHDYQLSRSSFEILFPRLRPGGLYAIEDWQWAHTPGIRLWRDKPALSNLVFQAMMICAGRPEMVDSVQVFPGVAFVKKGAAGPDSTRIDVESLCWMQGRTFNLL